MDNSSDSQVQMVELSTESQLDELVKEVLKNLESPNFDDY